LNALPSQNNVAGGKELRAGMGEGGGKFDKQ
jgi:hypothetical protein